MEQRINGDKRFALVIDADNVSARYVNVILDELSKYGTVTYKRIYGDWTSTLHSKWKNTLLDNSITPIQQFSYTQGKNATDHAMIIDAMDILYTGQVDGFCIVSSDSDFTRLAARIRESGLTVIGMGEKKTPLAFRKACDIFTTLELLIDEVPTQKDHVPGKSGRTTDAPAPAISRERIEEAVISIVTYNQNNGKDTGLGEVGSRLQKRYPDFDVRNYGTNQLRKLLESFESITVTKEGNTLSVSFSEGYEPPAMQDDAEKSASENASNETTAAVATDAEAENTAAAEAENAEAATPAESAEESEEAPKKKSRRGKRGGRRTKAKENDEQNADAESGEADDQSSEENSEVPTAEGKETKSHRGTRRRSSKINASLEESSPAEEPAQANTEAPEQKEDNVEDNTDEKPVEKTPVKRRPPRRPPVRRTFEQVASEKAAQVEEAVVEVVAEVTVEAEPATEEKPKRKRSTRSKKAKAAAETEAVAVITESEDETIVFSWPPSDEVVAALDEQQKADAAAEEKPKRKRSTRSKKTKAEEPAAAENKPAAEPAAEEKPKRKRTTRSKKAKAEEPAAAETKLVAEEKPATEDKPKRKRTTRSKKAAAEKPAVSSAEPMKKESDTAAKQAVDVEAVRAFARAQLTADPDIAPAALGKKIHAKFRGFKLSDNGFRTFKDFLKTV